MSIRDNTLVPQCMFQLLIRNYFLCNTEACHVLLRIIIPVSIAHSQLFPLQPCKGWGQPLSQSAVSIAHSQLFPLQRRCGILVLTQDKKFQLLIRNYFLCNMTVDLARLHGLIFGFNCSLAIISSATSWYTNLAILALP